MTRVIAVIPARMGSSRFPGKPLVPLLGRPMREHVFRRTVACPMVEDVIVATCDDEIRRAVDAFGGRAVMTSAAYERASDRVAEAVVTEAVDIIVMVPGDEPMIHPEIISEAVGPMLADPEVGCVNLTSPIRTSQEVLDPNTIKVAMDRSGDALFFSREPIPTMRNRPFLEHGFQVRMVRTNLETHAVDTPQDLRRVESVLASDPYTATYLGAA